MRSEREEDKWVSVNTAMSSESVVKKVPEQKHFFTDSVVFNIFRYVLMVCVGGRKVSR